MSDNIDNLPDINIVNLDVNCPICKKPTLKMLYKTIEIPYLGAILLSTIMCSNCGFKVTDVWTIFDEGTYEQYQKVRITPDTINDLVCASAGSKIRIPEIGAELDIKTFDAQSITTIEGVLREIQQSLKMLLETTENKELARNLLNLVSEEVENPTGRLTLILEDPKKHSALIPHKLWLKRVTRERIIESTELQKIGKEIIKKWRKLTELNR